MKLHEANTAGNNLFTGYGAGYVEINKTRFDGAQLVSPSERHDWQLAEFGQLEAAHFERILALQPEVVLLGTGDKLRFPHPRLYASLTNAGIGVEIMDTAAACRTYNILMQEGRAVVAALLPG